MSDITVICDRCGKTIEGIYIPADNGKGTTGGTGGYYDTSSQLWGQYANPNENIICDECMWKEPRYIAVYGEKG